MVFTHALPSVLLVASAMAATTKPQILNNNYYAGIVNFDSDIVEVSGDIVVPDCTPGLPYSSYSNYTTDGWVGINGWTLPPQKNISVNAGLLQTGVTCNANSVYHQNNYTFTRSPASYQIWTEWYPNPPIFFNDSDVRAGDVVHARVNKLSVSAGTSYLRNHRTGREWTWKYTDQSATLQALTNAEWITESETTISEELQLVEGILTANFTQWGFHDAKYRTRDGKMHLAADTYEIDCYCNGTMIAKAEFCEPGKLVVKNTTPANFTLNLG